MVSTESTFSQADRIMEAKKKFETEWIEAAKLFGTPEDTLESSTEENASGCPLRRETSPGGTIHDYYADGTEKKPDVSTAEPITLGRRIVLGFARQVPIRGMVDLHHLYQAESERLNAKFDVNDVNPRIEFLNRAGLRAVPEEELKTTAQLAGLIPTDDPDMSTRTLQFFEEFYAEYGMPNESEKEILSLFGRVSIPDLERWFEGKQRRIEPHMRLLEAAGIKR